MRSSALLGLFAACAIAAACTTTTIQSAPTAADAGATNGEPSVEAAPIEASQLGAGCSGFGTSLGQTAAFETEDCPAGICLVDAREGLTLYCSADCTNAVCPTGWSCQDVDHGTKGRACFKASATVEEDAGPTSFVDVKLPGYRADAKTSTSLAISDFKDVTKKARDLVVVVIGSRWDTFAPKVLQDLESTPISKVAMVALLADGTKAGAGATTTDLDAWHASYPSTHMLLDSQLAKLGSGTGKLGNGSGDISGYPTFIGYDAKTLKEVGRSRGYVSIEDLEATIDTWR